MGMATILGQRTATILAIFHFPNLRRLHIKFEQMSMYDHYFSKFGRPVSDDICKDSATRHPWFWRARFLKVFPIQMQKEANLTLP